MLELSRCCFPRQMGEKCLVDRFRIGTTVLGYRVTRTVVPVLFDIREPVYCDIRALSTVVSISLNTEEAGLDMIDHNEDGGVVSDLPMENVSETSSEVKSNQSEEDVQLLDRVTPLNPSEPALCVIHLHDENDIIGDVDMGGQRDNGYKITDEYQNNDQTHTTITSLEGVIEDLEAQIGWHVNTHQKKEPWKLPSQPEQAKDAMELRSGKVLFDPAPPEIFDNPINVSGDRVVSSDNDRNAKVGVGTSKGPEVNVSVLEVIEKMPTYAMFFKELNLKVRKKELNKMNFELTAELEEALAKNDYVQNNIDGDLCIIKEEFGLRNESLSKEFEKRMEVMVQEVLV
ncbi:hypothetical protein MRB53_021264 [Persea americana]|uniref:Uncharacterized protein n=1 Tax=Persea americana TaxID=3435 RepID=A0ACC2L392_PERAE|nr:hypothetical protein MRB53_021264 [Persea americana]